MTETIAFRRPVEQQGFAIFYHAVTLDRELSDGAKVTYALLLRYAQQSGACWPGIARLSEERGKSESSVSRHLSELETRGLISRQRRYGTSTVTYIEDPNDVYFHEEHPFEPVKNDMSNLSKMTCKEEEVEEQEVKYYTPQNGKDTSNANTRRNAIENSQGTPGRGGEEKPPKRIVVATGDEQLDQQNLRSAGIGAVLSTEVVAEELYRAVMGPTARWPGGPKLTKADKGARMPYVVVAQQILASVGWSKYEEAIGAIKWISDLIDLGEDDDIPKTLNIDFLARARNPGAWREQVIYHTLNKPTQEQQGRRALRIDA